jgi:hypothetical protein
MNDERHDVDDWLERATSALREETGAPNPRSGLTRARMLDSAEKRYAARRRPWLLRWLVPVTSVFVVGTALARVPDVWPAVREAVRPLLGLDEPKPQPKPRAKRPKTTPANSQPAAAGSASSPLAAPDAPAAGSSESAANGGNDLQAEQVEALRLRAERDESAQPKTPRISPALRRALAPRERPAPRRPAAPAPLAQAERTAAPEPEATAVTPGPAPKPARSAELELFRRAQSLHKARDARALAAWDAYLRVADKGVLVPEARYNRALCLVRLGRSAEARSALQPFAHGAYGDYRRAEARALLAKLE